MTRIEKPDNATKLKRIVGDFSRKVHEWIRDKSTGKIGVEVNMRSGGIGEHELHTMERIKDGKERS